MIAATTEREIPRGEKTYSAWFHGEHPVAREILRLAGRVRELETASYDNTVDAVEKLVALEEENRRLREGLGIASSFGGGATCPDGEPHRAKCSRCDAPLRFAPPH